MKIYLENTPGFGQSNDKNIWGHSSETETKILRDQTCHWCRTPRATKKLLPPLPLPLRAILEQLRTKRQTSQVCQANAHMEDVATEKVMARRCFAWSQIEFDTSWKQDDVSAEPRVFVNCTTKGTQAKKWSKIYVKPDSQVSTKKQHATTFFTPGVKLASSFSWTDSCDFLTVVCLLPDGPAGEKPFICTKLCEYRVDPEDNGKPSFEFRIPTIGTVCREAWILAVGFPNRNNSRVRDLEARIRRGETMPTPKTTVLKKGLTSTDIARAFIKNYILTNSQRSPVTTELYETLIAPACLLAHLLLINIAMCTQVCRVQWIEDTLRVVPARSSKKQTSVTVPLILFHVMAKANAPRCNRSHDRRVFQKFYSHKQSKGILQMR